MASPSLQLRGIYFFRNGSSLQDRICLHIIGEHFGFVENVYLNALSAHTAAHKIVGLPGLDQVVYKIKVVAFDEWPAYGYRKYDRVYYHGFA